MRVNVIVIGLVISIFSSCKKIETNYFEELLELAELNVEKLIVVPFDSSCSACYQNLLTSIQIDSLDLTDKGLALIITGDDKWERNRLQKVLASKNIPNIFIEPQKYYNWSFVKDNLSELSILLMDGSHKAKIRIEPLKASSQKDQVIQISSFFGFIE